MFLFFIRYHVEQGRGRALSGSGRPLARTSAGLARLVLVNTMIRLPNVVFAGGAVGKTPRESRSGLHVLEDDMHNLLLGSV